MANILLAIAVIGVVIVWRRTSFRVPNSVRVALTSRGRLALFIGCAVVLLTVGYSLGDVIAGRSQISKNPVRYATRMQGQEAHHHDLQAPRLFWRQVALQTGVGLATGGALLALGRLRLRAERRAMATSSRSIKGEIATS